MSQLLTEQEIADVTDMQKPSAQERELRRLGYVVLGRSAKGNVKCLALHPSDPRLKAMGPQSVTLDLS
jgi:hypothetical protein